MNRSYRTILDATARPYVPDDLDLFPKIAAKLEKGRYFMQPRTRVGITILLLVLALIVLTTAVYAYYRWIGDPGLQAVQDSGLITDLDIAGQPTIIPVTPGADVPKAATIMETAQTLEGVTVTLRWIYLDETRLAFGFDVHGLPEGLILAQPIVTFPEIHLDAIAPIEYGINFDDNHVAFGTFTSYQVIHAADVSGKLNVTIDLPLVKGQTAHTNQSPVIANFHFEVLNVPVYQGQYLGTFQTQSVAVNGIRVRLESVSVTPSFTSARICYERPSADSVWLILHATLQFGDSREVDSTGLELIRSDPQERCDIVNFPLGNSQNADQLILRIRELTVMLDPINDPVPPERIYAANAELARYGIEIAPAAPGEEDGLGGWKYVRCDPDTCGQQDNTLLIIDLLEESFPGPWEFYVDLTRTDDIPGLSTVTPVPPTPATGPLDSRTINDVTVTLDWIFADAKRVAIGYTITGLPDMPEATGLIGNISLAETTGAGETGWGGNATLQRVEGKPGVLQGSVSSVFRGPLTLSDARFIIDITLGSDAPNDFWNVIADFPIPPEATPYPPGVFPPALPDHKIGTFHFDVTAPIYPVQILKPEQMVLANALIMRLEKVEITPSFTTVLLCYPVPSDADWMIARAELKVGGYTAPNNTYTLIYDSNHGGYQDLPPAPLDLPQPEHGRCITLDFFLGHANIPGTITLTIPALEQSVPEGIPEDQIKAAQEKLSAQGIEMRYTIYEFAGGGGGSGPIFTKRPEGMTDVEAYQKFLDALGYIYPGPWVFVVNIIP